MFNFTRQAKKLRIENTLPPALLIVFKVVLFKIYFGSLQSAYKDVAPIASAHPN